MFGISLDRALAVIAENRIREAMDRGEFDALPGFGQPFTWDLETHDPNWWLRAKLKREELILRAQQYRARMGTAENQGPSAE